MGALALRVAARFVSGRGLNLADWGLEGLKNNTPVTLYHGTTQLFRSFDLQKSRSELVDRFYGAGIFLTPSKRVAVDYAHANRNAGFEPSVIADLKRKNRPAGEFLEELFKRGDDAWDDLTPETLGVVPEEFMTALEKRFGVDPNSISDVAQFIIGTKVKRLGADEPVHIFNMSTGLPDWAYKTLDELGLDSKTYRPKIYTVTARASNPLVTASKSEAARARHDGYDAVVYYGSDLVQGVPEVAVFDPSRVKVKHIEVL